MKGIEPLKKRVSSFRNITRVSEEGCRDNYAAALVIWGFEMKFEIKKLIK